MSLHFAALVNLFKNLVETLNEDSHISCSQIDASVIAASSYQNLNFRVQSPLYIYENSRTIFPYSCIITQHNFTTRYLFLSLITPKGPCTEVRADFAQTCF